MPRSFLKPNPTQLISIHGANRHARPRRSHFAAGLASRCVSDLPGLVVVGLGADVAATVVSAAAALVVAAAGACGRALVNPVRVDPGEEGVGCGGLEGQAVGWYALVGCPEFLMSVCPGCTASVVAVALPLPPPLPARVSARAPPATRPRPPCTCVPRSRGRGCGRVRERGGRPRALLHLAEGTLGAALPAASCGRVGVDAGGGV